MICSSISAVSPASNLSSETTLRTILSLPSFRFPLIGAIVNPAVEFPCAMLMFDEPINSKSTPSTAVDFSVLTANEIGVVLLSTLAVPVT